MRGCESSFFCYDHQRMSEKSVCVRCQAPIPAEWLEYGRCIGCRREYVELKKYSEQTVYARQQFHTTNGRRFMARYGKKLGRV
jgi:hypothetical protein